MRRCARDAATCRLVQPQISTVWEHAAVDGPGPVTCVSGRSTDSGEVTHAHRTFALIAPNADAELVDEGCPREWSAGEYEVVEACFQK